MYQKTLTLILAFATLFCLGYGITGFYALDPQSHSTCVENSDCTYSICCPLSGKSYGVCGQESECANLAGQSSVAQAPSLETSVETNYIAISLGVILLMILAIVGFLEWKAEKKAKRKRSRK